MTPTTHCRRPCCGPGGDSAVRARSLASPMAVPDRDQRLPRRDQEARSACCRSTTARPPARARPGRTDYRADLLEPYPDERLGSDSGLASPEARYEQREAVESAVAALQHLPPSQRAVLILRDVLGFSAREVAESLETTVASVNSSVQRARRTVEERLPERSQQATLAELGDDRLRRVVRNYIAAWESRDIDAMVAMLVADATFAMPPHPHWFRGREAVIAFLATTGKPDLRHAAYARTASRRSAGICATRRASAACRPRSRCSPSRATASARSRRSRAACARRAELGSLPDLFPRFGLPAELAASN